MSAANITVTVCCMHLGAWSILCHIGEWGEHTQVNPFCIASRKVRGWRIRKAVPIGPSRHGNRAHWTSKPSRTLFMSFAGHHQGTPPHEGQYVFHCNKSHHQFKRTLSHCSVRTLLLETPRTCIPGPRGLLVSDKGENLGMAKGAYGYVCEEGRKATVSNGGHSPFEANLRLRIEH